MSTFLKRTVVTCSEAWFARVSFLIVSWAALMYILLYVFGYPAMDSWAYFAPAVFAEKPLHLSMPLLDNFESADHLWGLNWPGYLLILSLFTPFLPKNSETFVIIMLGQWLLVSLLTCAWAKYLVQRPVWILGALGLSLLDFQYFNIAWFHRHELVACLALLGTIGSVHLLAIERGHRPVILLWLLGSFFFLPLLQPVCTLFGIAFLSLLILQSLLNRKVPFYLVPALGAYLLGVLGFCIFYFCQPGALQVLSDHAKVIGGDSFGAGFFPGKTFLLWLGDPKRIGENVIILGAMAFSIWSLPSLCKTFKERLSQIDTSPKTLTIFFFITLMALTQFTYNAYYMILVTPFAIILVCAGLESVAEKYSSRIALISLGIILFFQSFYFAGKIYVISRAGFPNIHQGLVDLRKSLPAGHLILIPVAMWETTLNNSGNFAMNTLPYGAGSVRRQHYEDFVYGQIRAGDLVLVDRLQDNLPLHLLQEPQWEKMRETKAFYFSGKDSGFDITIWRKR